MSLTPEQIEHRRLWVEALRSGEFKQGTGRLRPAYETKWCCLGVACEVYRRETNNGVWDDHGAFLPDDSDDRQRYSLPERIADWLGLTSDYADALVHRNDSGEPFLVIAAVIEEWTR